MNRFSYGFTLIEVLIVVAIIGVLAAIAYPSYQKHIIRSKRLDAQSEMLQIAQTMASYKLRNGTFAGATVNNVYGGTVTPNQGTALYDLAFSPTPTTANSWSLVATPKNGQAGNGALTLTDTGLQCWYKNKDTSYVAADCKKWTDR